MSTESQGDSTTPTDGDAQSPDHPESDGDGNDGGENTKPQLFEYKQYGSHDLDLEQLPEGALEVIEAVCEGLRGTVNGEDTTFVIRAISVADDARNYVSFRFDSGYHISSSRVKNQINWSDPDWSFKKMHSGKRGKDSIVIEPTEGQITMDYSTEQE